MSDDVSIHTLTRWADLVRWFRIDVIGVGLWFACHAALTISAAGAFWIVAYRLPEDDAIRIGTAGVLLPLFLVGFCLLLAKMMTVMSAFLLCAKTSLAGHQGTHSRKSS